MDATEDRLRVLRRIALLCLLAMLATITLSAYMRLSQAGLGCADWPACYGIALRDATGPPAPGHAIAAARLAHRVVASVVLVGSIVMLLATPSSSPALQRLRAPALALVGLALALAALGIVTPGARLPAVTLGNLLGGFAMLALCARLAVAGREDAAPGLGAWGTAGLLLLALQIALGAQTSASYAALSCTDLADCVHAATAGDWRSLDPLRAPVFDASGPMHRAAAPVLLLHRLGALVVVVAMAGLGTIAWRRGRRRGAALLLALTAAQVALGVTVVATGLPLPLVLLHNGVAPLLLATLLRLR